MNVTREKLSYSINKHLVNFDIREILSDLGGYLVPEDHAVPLRVALGHDGELLPGSATSRLECESHNALHSMSSKDGYLCGDRPRVTCMACTSVA